MPVAHTRWPAALSPKIIVTSWPAPQVAYKLAWTAISSLLSQYSQQHGPEILLYLNVAYFFPSIPVLILQTAFNDKCGHTRTHRGGFSGTHISLA